MACVHAFVCNGCVGMDPAATLPRMCSGRRICLCLCLCPCYRRKSDGKGQNLEVHLEHIDLFNEVSYACCNCSTILLKTTGGKNHLTCFICLFLSPKHIYPSSLASYLHILSHSNQPFFCFSLSFLSPRTSLLCLSSSRFFHPCHMDGGQAFPR